MRLYFERCHEDYERFRPSYPRAALDYLSARFHLGTAPAAADIGAGTGKLSRLMAARGWRVTAVEPGANMLRTAERTAAEEGLRISFVNGSAEETGLPDGAFDLVTAAQAFHWFDHERAVPELRRVLRAGGGIAILWNTRDERRSPFLKEMAELRTEFKPTDGWMGRDRRRNWGEVLQAGGLFGDARLTAFPNDLRVTHDQVVGWQRSHSTVAEGMTEEVRAEFEAALRRLCEGHFPDGIVECRQQTDVWTAVAL